VRTTQNDAEQGAELLTNQVYKNQKSAEQPNQLWKAKMTAQMKELNETALDNSYKCHIMGSKIVNQTQSTKVKNSIAICKLIFQAENNYNYYYMCTHYIYRVIMHAYVHLS